ncbi:MAG: hypothetical protein K8R36_22130 [Planctomycetales bacterium]|nr:hypothetical protein [Planctomycetales bacterium]
MKFSLCRISPKVRWYQFSLRTLLLAITAITVVCGLASNYRFCMLQAEFHRERESRLYIAGYFPARYLMAPNPELDKFISERMESSEDHRRLKVAYLLAAWRPWYRLSIDDVAAKVDEWSWAEALRNPLPKLGE